jgi:hypothetical protein
MVVSHKDTLKDVLNRALSFTPDPYFLTILRNYAYFDKLIHLDASSGLLSSSGSTRLSGGGNFHLSINFLKEGSQQKNIHNML